MSRDRVQVSVRLPLRTKAELEREAEERGLSRSEYIRRILDERHQADDLAERLVRREDRIDQLEEQLARRSEIEEKVDTLAKRQEESDAPFFVQWYRWWRGR